MRTISALLLLLSFTANAQAPLYQQTVVTTGDLRPGDVVTTIGVSNRKQISDKVRFPAVQWRNAACGGCTTDSWGSGSNTARNGNTLWPNVKSDTDILWIMLSNLGNARGCNTLSTYKSCMIDDVENILAYVQRNRPNVREVWLDGHHGSPFCSRAQPNNFAHASGEVADQFNNAQGYPFRVIHAAYLYAETTPRGDGLFWARSDFRSDQCHLDNGGNNKAARLLEEYMTNAISGDPIPDPDPDPEPQICAPTPPQTQCRIEGDLCHCRFPHTYTVL